MPYAVFNGLAEDGRHARRDYEVRYHRHQVDLERGGPRRVQVLELDPLTYRSWTWPQGLDEDQRLLWEAFLEANGWGQLPFLLRDPRDPVQELVTATLVSGSTYELPTSDSDPAYPLFPLASSVQAFDGGVPVAHTAVDQDARTVTFSAPATTPQVTFQPLRLVKLMPPPGGVALSSEQQVWATYQLELREVARDA